MKKTFLAVFLLLGTIPGWAQSSDLNRLEKLLQESATQGAASRLAWGSAFGTLALASAGGSVYSFTNSGMYGTMGGIVLAYYTGLFGLPAGINFLFPSQEERDRDLFAGQKDLAYWNLHLAEVAGQAHLTRMIVGGLTTGLGSLMALSSLTRQEYPDAGYLIGGLAFLGYGLSTLQFESASERTWKQWKGEASAGTPSVSLQLGPSGAGLALRL